MPAYALMQNGYVDATKSTGSPRDVEYALFTQITGRLNQAMAGDGDFPALAAAMSENLALWQTIALDVVDDDNAFPDMLRAQLFYLYEFTRAHTRKVLKREADAAALVEVNTSIMRGLRPTTPGKG